MIWPFDHPDHSRDATEKAILSTEQAELAVLKDIRRELRRLAYIKISFTGGIHPPHHHSHHHHHPGGSIMSQGPVTLTVGQSTTATVLGFDQNGAPFPIDFTANPVSWSLDQPSLDSSTPSGDTSSNVLTSLAAGVANLTATCAGFSDTEQVTNVAVAPKLSSVKIDFSAPTP